MEGLADVDDELTFLWDEVELCLDVAINTLTSLTSDGDNGGIGSPYFLLHGDGRETDFGIFLLTH